MSKNTGLTDEELARIGGPLKDEVDQKERDAEATRILREAAQARKDAQNVTPTT